MKKGETLTTYTFKIEQTIYKLTENKGDTLFCQNNG